MNSQATAQSSRVVFIWIVNIKQAFHVVIEFEIISLVDNENFLGQNQFQILTVPAALDTTLTLWSCLLSQPHENSQYFNIMTTLTILTGDEKAIKMEKTIFCE